MTFEKVLSKLVVNTIATGKLLLEEGGRSVCFKLFTKE